MYSVESLQYAVSGLFRNGIGEGYGYDANEVEELLDSINFHALLQAIRHKMGTAYAYITQGQHPNSFNYRGPDLFGQNAVCLYEDFDQVSAEAVVASRHTELWLLEDMTFVPVVRVTVSMCDSSYATEYRVVKECDPWQSEMTLDLEELAEVLRAMCVPCYECEIPVYEL